MRADIDGVVEHQIVAGVGVGIAGFRECVALGMERDESRALVRRHGAGGFARAQRLELEHDQKHLFEPFARDAGDDGAATRARFGEAGCFELADGLADGRARDAEFARKLDLLERQAGRQAAAHDLVRQKLADFLGAGAGRRTVGAFSHGNGVDQPNGILKSRLVS